MERLGRTPVGACGGGGGGGAGGEFLFESPLLSNSFSCLRLCREDKNGKLYKAWW